MAAIRVRKGHSTGLAAWALDKMLRDMAAYFPPGSGSVAEAILDQKRTHLEFWNLEQASDKELASLVSVLSEYEVELRRLGPSALADPNSVPGYIERVLELRVEIERVLSGELDQSKP